MSPFVFAECVTNSRRLTDRCVDGAYQIIVEQTGLDTAALLAGVSPLILGYAVRRITRQQELCALPCNLTSDEYRPGSYLH